MTSDHAAGSGADEPTDLEPGVYEHFRGARYEVIGVGRHSETEEPHVFYRQLYGDRAHWVRPLAMFVERVERDGYKGPRFRRVDGAEPPVSPPAPSARRPSP